MHFAKGAAHEAAFLRCNEDRFAAQRSLADDHAVIELLGQIENIKMRAHLALFRPDELMKAAGIEQRGDAFARADLVPADRCRIVQEGRGHSVSSSIRRTPWASRSATVSGRAPPSLIDIRRP